MKRPGLARFAGAGQPGEGRVSDRLLELFAVVDPDFSWLAKFISLLLLPFAHEDVAIILGGYIVVNKLMPSGLVAVCIYCGMVGSDFVLYGIGAGARRLPWLSRWAVSDQVKCFAEVFRRNMFGLVALCRVVPGVDFVAFIACGWMRVPLASFTLATLVVSALYLPLMLYLVVVFGDALDDRIGLWAWPALLGVALVAGFVRHRVFALQEVAPVATRSGGGRAAPARRASVGALRQPRQLLQLDVWARVPVLARRMKLW
jgi:membrane protein DedA with SNARE-associated domain